MKKKDYLILAGILLVHLFLLFYLMFTAWPEMSLWPYLITKGWMPYRDIAIAHTPLMLIDLTIFNKLFGVGILQLKIFTWILILLSDILIYIVVKRLWNKKTAFLSLIFYSLWMIFYDGNGLWFDLYMGVLAFCSFYFAKKRKWLWTGIFWTLAFISKQTAVWFLIPILFEMIVNLQQHYINKKIMNCRLSIKKFMKFTTGVAAVAVPFICLLAILGILSDFWNWAVKFGAFVLPSAQGQVQVPYIKTLFAALLPFAVFLPLIVGSRRYFTLALWALAGALGAYPRFEYFHFQPALPYLGIAASLILLQKKNLLLKVFISVYLICSLYLVSIYFARNFGKGTRFYEPEVGEIEMYVKYNSMPGDKIFVLNWWDNVYALTDTLPASKPWIPQLSWYMDMPGIQEKMVEDLKDNPPKLVVYKPYTNYGLSSYTPQKVYDYLTENYRIVENIDGIEILAR